MKKNTVSTSFYGRCIIAAIMIATIISNAHAVDRQKPILNEAALPVLDANGKHLNYDRQTLEAARRSQVQAHGDSRSTTSSMNATQGFLPGTSAQQPFWQYAIFGSGIGASNIVIGPTPPSGGPQIIIGGNSHSDFGNDDFWQVIQRNSVTGSYDQIFVSSIYQPRNGDPSAIVARIGLAHVTNLLDWQIVVMLGDGRVYLYDFATRAQVGYFDAGPYPFFFGLQALSLTDLNGDGLAEVIVTTSDDLRVFNGSGQLLWQVAGAGGDDVVAGQMDNDPAIEIAATSGKVVDAGTHAVQWTRNGGFGSYLKLAPFPGENYQQLIAAQDWDIVYSYDVGRQLPRWSIPIFDIGAIAVADVDNDGVPELIIGDGQWGSVHAYDLITQAEKWGVSNPEHGVTNIAVSDVDRDGVVDLLWGAGWTSTGPDYLYVANTTGSRDIKWQSLDLEGPFLGPAIGDLDGDGQPELVICSAYSDSQYASGRILVFDLATLSLRGISNPVTNSPTGVYDLKLRDVEGNGRMQIVVGTEDFSIGAAVEVYRFDSNNAFTRIWTNATGPFSGFNFVEVADLNNNGTRKVIAATYDYLYIYDYPSGAQSWQSVSLGSNDVTGLIVQDLNGDGSKEIAALVSNGDLYTWDGPSHQLRNLRQATDGKLLSNRATASGIVLGDSMGVGHFLQYGIDSYTETFTRQLASDCDPFGFDPCLNGINITADNSLWAGAANVLSVRLSPSYDTIGWQGPDVGSLFGRFVATDVRNGERHVFASAQNSVLGFVYTLPQAPALVTAVSRKTHGAAGTFDITLPSSGLGVESRSAGTGGTFVLVLTFDTNVVSGQANVTSGVGMVQGQPTFNGNQMTINLSGVANVQNITVMATNVMGVGGPAGSATVTYGILEGDTNGSRGVNASDIAFAKGRIGQGVNATNFRADVNGSGTINATDVAIVKARGGTGLP